MTCQRSTEVFMSCQIFISYRRKGGDDFAFLLHEYLNRDGYHVFFDTKSLESCDFSEEIEKSIKECTDFILVLSPGALDRCNNPDDWVRREISLALRHNKRIVPVMKAGFEFPKTLPEEFDHIRTIQAVNFPQEYFDAAYQRLVTVHLDSRLDDISRESEDKIKRGAAEGNLSMMNEYALKNEMGTQQTLENPAEAVRYYMEASEKELPAACYNLGDIYEKCSDDPVLAAEYKIHIPHSISDEEKTGYFTDIAMKYYKKAGDYAPALYRIGVISENSMDLTVAFSYYLKAAAQDYPPALNAVGFYLQYGLAEETLTDVERIERAEQYYGRAEAMGLAVAAYNHARLRENASDEEYVIAAYKRAFFSNPPIPQAAFALAKLYETRKRDKITARHYYQLALENGFRRAEKELSRLEQDIRSSR